MIIPDVSGDAKDTVQVSVDINNADEFVAFQLSLKLNAKLTYLEDSAALTARAADHSLSAGMVAGDTLRILAYSTSGTAFSGDSGSVATFSLILGTVPGTYALNPSKAFIADSNSNNILTGVTNGQLTLYAPEINLNTNTLNYTRTIVGNHQDMTFTISNNGNTTLSIDSLVAAPSSAYSVLPGWSTTVSASGLQVITVRFASPTKGSFPGTVEVYSDDPDEPSLEINLSGIGYKVNELRVNNLSIRSGTDTTLSFRINNQEPFTGFQFDLALPTPMTCLANSEELTGRANGHSVDANVVTGGKLRVVAYSSNRSTFSDSDGDVVKIGFHVEGTGGSYSLPLSNVIITDSTAQNILSDSYNGQLSIAAGDIQSSTSINYGSVSILDTAHVNLTIRNVGNDTLLISSFTPNDAHFWADVSLPLTINPSQQAVVPTYFHSSTQGSFSGKYTLRSNDPDEDPYTISLSAMAYSPNTMAVEDATGAPGGHMDIYVDINNHDPFTAFQLDLVLPSLFTVVLDSCKLTSRSQGHTLSKGLISGNTYRFVAYSGSKSLFTGNSGAVLRVLCSVSGDTGIYPITIQDPIISDVNSRNILSIYSNGTLTVAAPPVPPAAPRGLAAVAYANWVWLVWFANTESDLHTYYIYRDTSPSPTALLDSVVAQSPPDTFYVDRKVQTGTMYYYRITAADSVGNESEYSNEVALPYLPGDFNRDGCIRLDDFSLFVKYYGKCRGEAGFNLLYDLDGDGCIGLGDFSIFAQNYGKCIGSAKAVPATVGKNGEASLSIDMVDRSEEPSGDVKFHLQLDGVRRLKGYSFKVRYDPSRFDFRGAEQIGEDFPDAGNRLWSPLVVSSTAGEVLIADVARGDEVIQGGGVLVELCFKCKETPEHAKFTVTEGIFMDVEGEIHALGSTEMVSSPRELALLQNFPNPFNASTVLRVQLPKVSEVRLSIYNLLGQEVRRLVDGEMEAGTYSVQWDGRDGFGRPLASGVYLCRFRAGDFTQTKRIVLLR